MAKRLSHPARTLIVFVMVVGVLYGLAAIAGTWKPKLGLDLAGGTRFTLVPDAKMKAPSNSQLEQAASIIRQRVNGNGVTEAKVSVAGPNVRVEIPGELTQDMEASIARQAQLRFRVLADTSATGGSMPDVQGALSTEQDLQWAKTPTSGWIAAVKTAICNPDAPGIALVPPFVNTLPWNSSMSEADLAKALAPFEKKLTAATKKLEAAQKKTPKDAKEIAVLQQAVTALYVVPTDTDDRPLIACNDQGQISLLSPAAIDGDQISSASAGMDSQTVGWAVNLGFKGKGADIFEDLSRHMVAGGDYGGMQFAIVLDGTLLSAPGFNGIISGGQAQITGTFTQDEATGLANSLNFGSLPVKFDLGASSNEAISAELAGSQLAAGLIAGVIGLLIVMLYCFIYYRGLGLVVVSSLIVAAVVTYVIVLLLGKTAGFALSLPGIAGLIVAVGITADSFIVYFERIRDEMREGKSMRMAVQVGWVRARNTCLAADTVSLLAAVALYLFAIDEIRGFAFALGISTLIDVAVFFWFTHPVISLLSHRRFFNDGHKLSGLSPESLGVARRRRLTGKVGA